MAFRTAGTLDAREEITVAFGLNGEGRELCLRARVVRILTGSSGVRRFFCHRSVSSR